MTSSDRKPLVVGYLVGRYPELSQTFVRLEVEALRRAGVDVKVAALRRGSVATDDADLVRLNELAGDRRALLRAVGAAVVRPWRLARAAAAWRRVADEFGREGTMVRPHGVLILAARWRRDGVQHVHAHFAWEGAAAAMVVAPLLGVTWSMTVHANDMYAKRRNLRAKLRAADRVVTVCEYNRRRLMTWEGVRGEIPVVYCGVEAVRDPVPAAAGALDIVAVGRLVEKKGFDLLVTAVRLLIERHRDLRVAILGDGPMRSSLEELVVRLGLQEVVELRGARPHDEVLATITDARLLAHPCRIGADDDRESMPVVVKEAMIRAVPVVGTDVAAMGEMIDASCGRLVEPNDPVALADALDELLSDDALRRSLGHQARARALEAFTIDTSAELLEREFRSLAR